LSAPRPITNVPVASFAAAIPDVTGGATLDQNPQVLPVCSIMFTNRSAPRPKKATPPPASVATAPAFGSTVAGGNAVMHGLVCSAVALSTRVAVPQAGSIA
jgi:hypothetical protein